MKPRGAIARSSRAAALLLLALLALSAPAADPSTTGVVLMHGWGLRSEPVRENPFAHNWLLSKTLREAGYRVAEEEMAWGPNRLLDVSRDAAMAEIDALVAHLRAAGARRIVVAGHSWGATMAIAYGGQRRVDGIAALGPGNHVELSGRLFPDVAPAQVTRARRLIASGRGEEPAAFMGINCCFIFREFTTTPAIYLSWFDPDGAGRMDRNSAAVAPGTFVLLAYGRDDPIFGAFARAKLSYADYLCERLAPGVHRERVIVEANHGGVPSAAVPAVMKWLASLPP